MCNFSAAQVVHFNLGSITLVLKGRITNRYIKQKQIS